MNDEEKRDVEKRFLQLKELLSTDGGKDFLLALQLKDISHHLYAMQQLLIKKGKFTEEEYNKEYKETFKHTNQVRDLAEKLSKGM